MPSHSLSHSEAVEDARERVSRRRADRMARAEQFYDGPIPAAVWKWINEGDKSDAAK